MHLRLLASITPTMAHSDLDPLDGTRIHPDEYGAFGWRCLSVCFGFG
jgi:hypothetical protein